MHLWVSDIHECSTVACALGHACLDSSFQEQGLRYDGVEPRFGDLGGFEAGCAFFGLNWKEVNWLFSSYDYEYEVCTNTEVKAECLRRINEQIAVKLNASAA